MNMTIQRITKAAATLVLAASAMATVGAASAQAADTRAAGSERGCPDGAVCIYPRDAGFNNGRPSHAFFSYGPHNLANQFGNHVLFNNQVEGARVSTCTGFDGRGNCAGFIPAGRSIVTNLTPINSVVLFEVPRQRTGQPQP